MSNNKISALRAHLAAIAQTNMDITSVRQRVSVAQRAIKDAEEARAHLEGLRAMRSEVEADEFVGGVVADTAQIAKDIAGAQEAAVLAENRAAAARNAIARLEGENERLQGEIRRLTGETAELRRQAGMEQLMPAVEVYLGHVRALAASYAMVIGISKAIDRLTPPNEARLVSGIHVDRLVPPLPNLPHLPAEMVAIDISADIGKAENEAAALLEIGS